ncbi:hypothetical protein F4604DRAFT_1939941 [Suillus subluteus]|nr:hypothetical protein F4604DRAFT_1939941 [Suillus subluteus]
MSHRTTSNSADMDLLPRPLAGSQDRLYCPLLVVSVITHLSQLFHPASTESSHVRLSPLLYLDSLYLGLDLPAAPLALDFSSHIGITPRYLTPAFLIGISHRVYCRYPISCRTSLDLDLRDTLDDHFGDFNWKKVTNLGTSLLQKLKATIPEQYQHQWDFDEFNETLITECPEEPNNSKSKRLWLAKDLVGVL